MTARRLVVLLAPMVLALAGVAPATASVPNTCPATDSDPVTVIVTGPPARSTVSGAVTVSGQAFGPVGLTRVELFVGNALRDFQVVDPPRPSTEFSLKWNTAESPAGPAQVSVVVCGGAPGPLLQGVATLDLVVGPPPQTTAPARLTVAESGDRPRTGPAWVGAVFAGAGLAGLLAAMTSWRVRRPPSA